MPNTVDLGAASGDGHIPYFVQAIRPASWRWPVSLAGSSLRRWGLEGGALQDGPDGIRIVQDTGGAERGPSGKSAATQLSLDRRGACYDGRYPLEVVELQTTTPPTRSRRPFYGWWIVVSSVAFHGITGAAFGFTFGQYLLRFEEHFGWSKFAITSAFSASQLAAGVLSPAHGWLIDRFSPRSVTRVGVLVMGGSFMLLPVANSFPLFLAIILMMSIGMNLAGWLTLTTVITRWFRRKRALALGLSSTGIGIAGVLSLIVAWSLTTHGWQATAFGTGVVIIITGMPLAQLLRGYPEQHGLLPDGARAWTPSSADPTPRDPDGDDFTVGEAMRDRSFWYVSFGHGVALIAVFTVLVHLVPHLVEGLGWSETSAQAMLTLVTVTSIVGQVGGGFIGDRYNKTRIAAFCMLGHAIGMGILVVAPNGFVIALAALIHGLAWGTRGPLMMAIRADFYGRRHFGKIAGYSNVMVMLGPLIGPTFAGAMSDRFGDYSGAFLGVAVMVAMGSVFFFFARKPPVPARLRPRTANA